MSSPCKFEVDGGPCGHLAFQHSQGLTGPHCDGCCASGLGTGDVMHRYNQRQRATRVGRPSPVESALHREEEGR